MNGIAYVFKIRGSVTMTKIKNQFQEIFRGTQNSDGTFKYEFFDIFWNNQGLRTQLFPNETDEIAGKVKFKILVNDKTSLIYSFIK